MVEMSDDFEFQLQQEFKESVAKESTADTAADGQQKTNYVDPNDGTEYEWNPRIKGWVPKIDEDFIAKYQSSYGVVATDDSSSGQTTAANSETQSESTAGDKAENGEETTEPAKRSADQPKDKKVFVSKLLNKAKIEPKKAEWFEVSEEHNTKVYVSNLPDDITEDEFIELMKKCGLIAKDDQNRFKIKIYRDRNGQPKGDGLCDYLKVESVQLALDILDGYQIKDKTIAVERAKFSLKGQYDPTLKPKRTKKDKQKEKKKIQKLLDWRPERLVTERAKSEKTVVIKNMFDPKEFMREPKLILEYRSDLRDECTEKCGEVRRVDVHDCHPEGVATITFQEFDSADQCVQLMNGRFFAGRRLTAEHWDGKTRYKMEETEEEAEKRMKQWDDFLESEDK